MPQAEDAVQKDPSAAEGGIENESAAPQTDWKALYEKEQEAHRNSSEKEAQWKEAALKNKRLLKERTQVETTEPEVETEDERVSRLASEVSRRVVTTVTEDSLLKSKVTDPEQRRLVKFYLENRIQRTGTSEEALESDIEFAISAANSKKVAIENKELKRLQANDSRVTPAAGSTADRGVERKPHQWSADQEKILTEKARALRIDPAKFLKDSWDNRSRTHVA